MDNMTLASHSLWHGRDDHHLWVMSLIMRLLTRIFPHKEGEDGN